jgi:hypothetical protein
MGLERWVKIAGIITGAAALASVAITLIQLHNDFAQAEIRDWQDTAGFARSCDRDLGGRYTSPI